jgi:hypothetical protein
LLNRAILRTELPLGYDQVLIETDKFNVLLVVVVDLQNGSKSSAIACWT